ncbi:MAG: hypothetical protein DDT26_01049 [Dehalococcoidia bacterium]|nr:hypothetical protein [Chloroflexota bacterium]
MMTNGDSKCPTARYVPSVLKTTELTLLDGKLAGLGNLVKISPERL